MLNSIDIVLDYNLIHLNQISCWAITLHHRTTQWNNLIVHSPIHINKFIGVNAKEIGLHQTVKQSPTNLSSEYVQHGETNITEFNSGLTDVLHLGHYGATISHLQLMKRMADSNSKQPMLILEDDVQFVPDFNDRLTKIVNYFNHNHVSWDIMLLGFSCQYDHHVNCTANDHYPVKHGVTQVKYFFGCWAYMIRDSQAAKRILRLCTPVTWHVDLLLADLAYKGKINVLGCIPTLVNHPGKMRIPSWDWTQHGNDSIYYSDTNTTKEN